MIRTLTYSIPCEYSGKKISEFLRNQGYSKQLLTVLRHTEHSIFLGDEEVHMNHVAFTAQKLIVHLHETEKASEIAPVDLPIQILFEDEDIFVINKSAGMPIHPSCTHPDNTLANALAHLYQKQGEPFVYRCVNRLDKDTSGLTIIAKNALSAGILYEDVKVRNVNRTYFAIVQNDSSDLLPRSGTIKLPISREEATDRPHSIKRFVDEEKGAPAITHYTVLQQNDKYAFVELHLDTGRTHQIRVHMQAIHHPLIGDPIYNPTEHSMNRHALHAGKITFPHPITRELLTFEVPLPDDMAAFFTY